MNVEDVRDEAPETEDMMATIVARQTELMERYHPIEERNGFRVCEAPCDLDDRFAQHRLKDFAWRVTEELAEAMDAAWEGWSIEADRATSERSLVHQQEEVADALHFLVELCLVAGHSIGDRPLAGWIADDRRTATPVAFSQACVVVVGQLGMAMNHLKNKPWKQSHRPTDAAAFHARIGRVITAFWGVARTAEMGPEDLYRMYFRKSEVNRFRQRSEY